jgi:flavin reductase (DIM6/NTAB) family NADH-FMN oxidoreductase RutF
VAVIVHKDNYTHELMRKSKVFSASVVADTAPITLIARLGCKSGRDFDKMAEIECKEGITGCPMVTEHALSVLEAEVIEG